MSVRLWFIRKNSDPVAVYTSRRLAREELEELRNNEDESDETIFKMYYIDFDDLADHPDELELAEDEGLV